MILSVDSFQNATGDFSPSSITVYTMNKKLMRVTTQMIIVQDISLGLQVEDSHICAVELLSLILLS